MSHSSSQRTPRKSIVRRRPRLSVTVSADTLNTLNQICRETGLPSDLVALDFVVTDWRRRLSGGGSDGAK